MVGGFGKLSDQYQYGLVPALVPRLAVFSSKLTLAGARKQPSRSGNRNKSHAQTKFSFFPDFERHLPDAVKLPSRSSLAC